MYATKSGPLKGVDDSVIIQGRLNTKQNIFGTIIESRTH